MSTSPPAVAALRVLGVAVSTLLVLALALGVATSFARTTADETFSVAEVDRVLVSVEAGEVVVEPSDDGRVSVRLTSEGTWATPEAERRQDGSTLVLTSRCGPTIGFARCDAGYRIAVPDGVDVEVRATAGRVTVDGIDGDVVARAEAGDIRLTDLRSSRVEAHVDVGLARVTFESVPDDVRATAEVGPVEVVLPLDGEPYAVDARADVGEASVDVRTDPQSPRRVTAVASVGAVSVSGR